MLRKYSEGEDYKVVAFVVAGFFYDEQMRIMKKVVREAAKRHYKVVFFSTLSDFYTNDLNAAGEKKMFDAISVESYDAIVLMSETFKEDTQQLALVEKANKAGVPVITVDKGFDGCINFAFDYGNAFREVVRHMVEDHGYRTINFMGGIPGNRFSEERLTVFKEVLAQNQIPYEPERTYWGYFWEDPTEAAMQKMFADALPMPEAIICANDTMAMTVCKCLQEKGYLVPEDVAVSGFDGIEIERYNRPRLTTGIRNVDAFIRMLFDMIAAGKYQNGENGKVLVYNKMQIGGSCGCPNPESAQVTSEMGKLKAKLIQQIEYQGNLNQLIVNFGHAERFSDIIEALPEYMGPLCYKTFWFCANTDLIEETEIRTQSYEGAYAADNASYTKSMNVLRCCNNGEKTETDYWKNMEFGELIPDRKKQLEENDFLLVLVMHMKGKAVGYTAITFDLDLFWFTAYAAFITSFRQLLEMQKAQMELMRVYMCDLLTGLYNRNGFYQKIQALLQMAEEMDMTVISMDMDGLKRINDTYGHAEGDEAIRALGSIIKASIHHELGARIGGDEFLVVFAGRDIDRRTQEIVDLVNQGIRSYNETSGKVYEIHASIGVYTNRVKTHTLDDFLKKADDLMYAKKYLNKKERGDI